MTKIKFGTDGWRAIIAEEFTVENVARVSVATAQWLKKNYDNHTVVIGHDCRFAGELFAETATKVFAANGIKVLLAKGFVSTPMVSLGANHYKTALGVVLTASHNPPSYNGYKLKAHFGGPLAPDKVQEIEDIIPDTHSVDLSVSVKDLVNQGMVEYVDLETLYVEHVKKNFDLELIKKSGLRLAYDAMYGAGQNVLK
ncbi:MAG: phosphoglucomutase/phosphomannomutase family protein, partial [Bacteroidia bacterium]